MTTSIQFRPNPFIFNPLSQTQIPSRKSTTLITYAKRTKPFFKSKKSTKPFIQFARFAASNFHHVLPSPYNTIVHHLAFSGGDGGGIRRTPFSGGGGGGGGGRRRRVSKNSQFWVFLGLGLGFVCCLVGLGFKDEVVVLGGLCLTMLLVIVKSGFVPDWLLGFCGGGVVVGVLGCKKDEVRKMVDSGVKAVGTGSGMGRRRRSGRRWYKF